PLGSHVTVGITLLTTPATQPRTVVVTSNDPTVAQVINQTVVIPAGAQVATIDLNTGGAGTATLTFDIGGVKSQFSVVVGTSPTPGTSPIVAAPPVGVSATSAI